VEAVHPHIGSIAETVTADGVLTPVAQATVMAKVAEPIRSFNVQRGSHVRAGEVIAVLESADLEAAAIESRGEFEAAQGAYDKAMNSTIPTEQRLAESDLAEAKRQLDIASESLDNVQWMYTRGVTTPRTMEAARLAVSHAKTVYAQASEHYQDLQHAGHDTAVATAKGLLEAARGRKLAAEAQLSYAKIRSPIDGVIADCPLSPGEIPAAGTPIATIVDTSSMIAKLHMGQAEAQRLPAGSVARLFVPGIDSPRDAVVTLVSPALDLGSTTVEVWLSVKNRDGALKPGTPVHGVIPGRVATQAMLIPTRAVLRSSTNGTTTVLLSGADGVARQREIQIGLQTVDWTQVTSGLIADDLVIAANGEGLTDGVKVEAQSTGSQKP
jgi:multidrug efflux pump subunit AcrA (membrane-fusion protein)